MANVSQIDKSCYRYILSLCGRQLERTLENTWNVGECIDQGIRAELALIRCGKRCRDGP